MDLTELQELFSKICPECRGLNTAYLFGSRARGEANPSDYDVGLVFNQRLGLSPSERYNECEKLYFLLCPHINPLDVVDLNSGNDVLLKRVLRDKKILYCADRALRIDWEVYTRHKIFDMAPIHEMYKQALFSRIREEAKDL